MAQKFTEVQLIEGIKRNDTRAINALFEELYPALRYFARSLISSNEDAEEIALSAFTKFYFLRENFDSLSNIKAFLYITTRNQCLDYFRKIKRDTRMYKELSYAAGSENYVFADNKVIEAELIRQINSVVEQLPKKYRRIFELIFIENKNTDEAAQELKTTTANIRQMKSRTMQLLRMRLLEKGLVALTILKWWC